MARARVSRTAQEELIIHEDDTRTEQEEDEVYMQESRDPLEESGFTRSDSSEDEESVDDAVAEDMLRLEESFKGINKRYKLINRIGEGTFSTVYKAQDLMYDMYQNDWDIEEKENAKWSTPSKKNRSSRRKARYVAIKKIYVTSSPTRIFNELELLKDLRNSDSVCPLITAFRYQDQVVAILPYFQHHDFREYFRTMEVAEMRVYFRSLFTALSAVHEQGILHRDIKPTNFLYHPDQGRGVLVDFGLAEREGTDHHDCLCELSSVKRRQRYELSVASLQNNSSQPLSYPKTDQRPSRRANRAGTRGFRAPEVLFKCTSQGTAIDIWSAGVILLTLLARRFPFFHSADDVDALLELTNIFGKKKMREAALLHGQVFETNIPSYSEAGHNFEKIILWSTNRTARDANQQRIYHLSDDEVEAVRFLERLLDCNPHERITAEQALSHSFLARAGMGDDDEDTVDLVSP